MSIPPTWRLVGRPGEHFGGLAERLIAAGLHPVSGANREK